MTKIRSTSFLLFGIILSLALVVLSTELDVERFMNNAKIRQCYLTDGYWKLIAWFFGRITYIEATEVVVDTVTNPKFSSFIIKEMSRKTSASVISYTVNYAFEEPRKYFYDNYKRYGREFESREELANLTEKHHPHYSYVRQQFNVTSKSKHQKTRRDEPELGGLIFVNKLETLENYIVGPPRRPFNNPAGNYVIIINEKIDENGWDLAAHVLYVLWRDYRILNVFLILSCELQEVIGYYDPFEVNNDSYKYPKWQDSWGAMKWTQLDTINTKTGWIFNTVNNLEGYPFISTMFMRYPTVIMADELPETFLKSYFASAIKYADGYAGFDGLVLGNIAKALNFRAYFIIANSYGSRLPNYTFTGSIGDVLYQRADAAFNSRFIEEYDTNDIEFLYPVFSDKFCFIAPAALEIPSWKAIFQCFTTNVWWTIFLGGVMCSVFWYALRHTAGYWRRQYKGLRSFTIIDAALGTILVMCSSPIKLPVPSVERILLAGFLVANVIIVGIFQGSLTTSYSKSAFEKEINTLAQLDKSGLPIIASEDTIQTLFSDKEGRVISSLRTKLQVGEFPVLYGAAYYRNMCGIERLSDVNIIIKTTLKSPKGRGLVHVVGECPRSYNLAYIVKKGSPYRARFNRILMNFFEFGLLAKWYEQTEYALTTNAKYRDDYMEPSVIVFSMIEMQFAFMILGVGQLISACVLVCEIFNKCACFHR